MSTLYIWALCFCIYVPSKYFSKKFFPLPIPKQKQQKWSRTAWLKFKGGWILSKFYPQLHIKREFFLNFN